MHFTYPRKNSRVSVTTTKFALPLEQIHKHKNDLFNTNKLIRTGQFNKNNDCLNEFEFEFLTELPAILKC